MTCNSRPELLHVQSRQNRRSVIQCVHHTDWLCDYGEMDMKTFSNLDALNKLMFYERDGWRVLTEASHGLAVWTFGNKPEQPNFIQPHELADWCHDVPIAIRALQAASSRNINAQEVTRSSSRGDFLEKLLTKGTQTLRSTPKDSENVRWLAPYDPIFSIADDRVKIRVIRRDLSEQLYEAMLKILAV